jgi:hypothetical protein
MVFLDYADEPGALAYHDLTPSGLPLSKVFVRTTLENGDLVSVSASHAYESADPVESLSFNVDGIPMSDFVYPAYFEAFHKTGSVTFDHMKKVNKPFQILSGGYQIIFKNGKWSETFGSKTKKKHFAREDRRGHRSEQRPKATRNKLERTDEKAVARAERMAKGT